MSRILLAFDASDGSLGAVTALSHWNLAGSHVTVLTVVSPGEWPSRQVARLRETTAQTLRRRGAHVELALREGSPEPVIRELARHERADLIVLGPRKRPALSQRFLGSVSADVLRDAPCSVLIGRLSLATERALVLLTEPEHLRAITLAWERLPLPVRLDTTLLGVSRALPQLTLTAQLRHLRPERIPQASAAAESSRLQTLLDAADAFMRSRGVASLGLTARQGDAREILELEKESTPELLVIPGSAEADWRDLAAQARASVLVLNGL